jgi:aryl-alcohol dehydrogenase-like predicted oxidoreductase
MKNPIFGRTGREVSEIGFGSWGIGGAQWVAVDDAEALRALKTSLELGVTFIDTADVYGDGRSEKLIAQALRGHKGARPFIATKAGKRLPEQLTSVTPLRTCGSGQSAAATTSRRIFSISCSSIVRQLTCITIRRSSRRWTNWSTTG